MVVLPNNAPERDNDLEDKLRLALNPSKADPNARIFAFGEQWPGTNRPDQYFPEIKTRNCTTFTSTRATRGATTTTTTACSRTAAC